MKDEGRWWVVCICLVFAVGLAKAALADPKGKEKQGNPHEAKGKSHHHDEVEFKQGGPPPWAPAHGYRRQSDDDDHDDDHEHHGDHHEHHDDHVTVVQPAAPVYVVPFGIDLGRCNREQLGSVIGGALGGVAGSHVGKGAGRTAAIIGGTVLGVLVGGSIGRTMDQVDQACVGQILEHSANQRPVAWQNPDQRLGYNVTPLQTYRDVQGQYCREYLTTAVIGGKQQNVYGTACRQPDGSWKLMP